MCDKPISVFKIALAQSNVPKHYSRGGPVTIKCPCDRAINRLKFLNRAPTEPLLVEAAVLTAVLHQVPREQVLCCSRLPSTCSKPLAAASFTLLLQPQEALVAQLTASTVVRAQG